MEILPFSNTVTSVCCELRFHSLVITTLGDPITLHHWAQYRRVIFC